MKYYEITVTTNHQNSDIVADIMNEITGDGVCIVDREDLAVETWDYVEENLVENFPKEVFVKGYCALEKIDKIIADLRNSLGKMGVTEIVSQILDDEIWKDEWKKNYYPVPIGNVIICPVWLDDGKAENVLIDTGLAFGTGQHETTSLCVELLQKIEVANKTVLDIGCGSGVLGLCAAKLGAQKVTLIDNDDLAADTAKRNIALNNFEKICLAKQGNLADDTNEKYDIVLANLTAPILTELRKGIDNVVKKGTYLILSGILNSYCVDVEKAYSAFCLQEKIVKGEWCALMYKV
ncbi:MAG TPA: 50S ribosomal protein L11 methyltransferase [Clostridia bacterium]|nr:50S ribosomal protein L11 methyltransferase [Clostridia bacterium]